MTAHKSAKKKKKIKVVKITPHVKPHVHEVVLHVESLDDPPAVELPVELESDLELEPVATEPLSGVDEIANATKIEEPEVKKKGFWFWLGW